MSSIYYKWAIIRNLPFLIILNASGKYSEAVQPYSKILARSSITQRRSQSRTVRIPFLTFAVVNMKPIDP